MMTKTVSEMASVLPTSARSFSHGNPMPLKSKKYLATVIALLLVIIVPYIHIGIFYLKLWVPDKRPIDKEQCTCSCFDTVFKGSYESPGNSRYKHIYFNATQNTFKIWAVTAVFMVMFYESIKYLIGLYHTKQFHLSWVFLYLVNIYPNYYSWWMMFGYYNDEFYRYLSHQIYFGMTEIIVTATVLNLCNKQSEPQLWKILLVVAISFVHVFVSSLDQFVTNVILGQGKSFQNSRDFGLMIPDLLHLLVASYWYVKLVYFSEADSGGARNKEEQMALSISSKVFNGTRKRDVLFVAFIVVFLIGLSHIL